ncbi:death-on-curing protein (plasmid) [Citricoccus nitrophenolicus]
MTVLLTLEEALRIADRLKVPVRDPGLLAAALVRPAASFGGIPVYTGMAMQAAVLLESVARSGAFIAGNRQVAVATMQVFLRINGYQHDLSDDQVVHLVGQLVAGKLDAREVAEVLAGRKVVTLSEDQTSRPAGRVRSLLGAARSWGRRRKIV